MTRGYRLQLEPLEDRLLLSAGALDPGFGSGGEVVTRFSPGQDSVSQVAFQADGKVLVVGYESAPSPDVKSDIFVARYDGHGQLDPTFGTGGKVVIDLWDATIGVLPDGKILVAGRFDTSVLGAELLRHNHDSFGPVAALARYNPDGSPDTTFGTGGKVLDKTLFGFAILGQANGKILVESLPDDVVIPGGGLPLGGQVPVVVVRYDGQGQLDPSFGTGGKVVTGLQDAVGALQADGKILLAGSLYARFTSSLEMARFNADGSPDATFGAGSQVAATDNPYRVVGVAVQSDGRIVVAGYSYVPNGQGQATLFRLYADGSRDTGFGNAGEVVTGDSWQVVGVALQADGRIVVAGTSMSQPGSDLDMVVARYNTDGSLDRTFPVNGRALADFGGLDRAAGLGIQLDGKIVVVGWTQANEFSPQHTALARFLPDDAAENLQQRFVTQVYLNLLDRVPDPGGLALFSTALANGQTTAAQVVQAIEDSPEYQTKAVADLYTRLLGRPADPFGLGVYTSFLAAGGSLRQVESDILGSPEYAYHYRELGGDDPPTFLSHLYYDVLGRSPDAAGESTFSSMLSNGVSRSAVAAMVLAGVEAKQYQVETLYERFLGRTAAAGELATFTDAMQQGMPLEAVEADILGSEEYLSHL
jgi:uncharacterized delta-60 repeat protein